VADRGGVALSSDLDTGADSDRDTGWSPERSPWASPDPRPRGSGTPFGAAPPARTPGTPLWQDVRAGLLTVAVTVLVGAPVGLLWAALAPRVMIEVTGDDVQVLDTYADGFIAVDAWFFAAVVVAGLVGGALAWWLGADHGPAVVLGLVVGGLAAAWIAGRVGGEVDRTTVQQLLASGVQGRRELAVQLRATSALLGWPIASLVAFLALSVARRPAAAPAAPDVSSG
jgi:hypothetical protein